MNLFEKGLFCYKQILSFVDDKYDNVLANYKCNLTCTTSCPDCLNKKAHLEEYYVALVINRLYYSLYQMHKSLIEDKREEYFSHDHIGDVATKWSKIQIKDTSLTIVDYQNYLTKLDNLKFYRHVVDYKLNCETQIKSVSKPAIDIEEEIIQAIDICEFFQKLGIPQC